MLVYNEIFGVIYFDVRLLIVLYWIYNMKFGNHLLHIDI